MKKTVLKKDSSGFAHLGLLITLLLIIGVVAFVFLKISKSRTSSNGELRSVSIRLAWLHQAQFTGLYVAKEKGYYAEEGLDVSLKEYEDGVDINKEVAEGTSTFGVGTPLDIILARDSGYKVKGIAAIYQTSPYVIASRKEANIKSPADFKGKVLGNIGDNPQAKTTYATLLAGAGVETGEVTIKPVDFDLVAVFQKKEADTGDIYRTDQTYLLDKANIEYNLLYPEQFGFAIYGDVLTTSDTMVENDPDTVQAFVRASLKGWQFAIDNPDEALTYVQKYENELYKDSAYEKFILENSIPLIKPTGGNSLGYMHFIPWNRAYQGVEEAGLLKTKFEPRDLYVDQFVD